MGQQSSCSSDSEWTYAVCLYPNATDGSNYVSMGSNGIVMEMSSRIDISETIKSVSVYETKSHDSATCLNHKIFVFETESCFYSAEKTKVNIIVQRQEIKTTQREKELLTLVSHCRGRKRKETPEKLKKLKDKKRTVENFITHFLKVQINEEYSVCSNNCKHFVKCGFAWYHSAKNIISSKFNKKQSESLPFRERIYAYIS